MDDLDRAQQIEELERENSLKIRKPTLTAVGVCWNCGEPLQAGVLFCDLDCRDDYEREQKSKRINGG